MDVYSLAYESTVYCVRHELRKKKKKIVYLQQAMSYTPAVMFLKCTVCLFANL